jgi:hypothetical protein
VGAEENEEGEMDGEEGKVIDIICEQRRRLDQGLVGEGMLRLYWRGE